MSSIFKTYDIRGEYPAQWNQETAYRIGRYLPALMGVESILVGRDARLSSEEICKALARGILESGCNVVDVGQCSTPSLYFATSYYDFGASVMITASHNPPQYNGLKISGRDSIPVGHANGLAELERHTLHDPGSGTAQGTHCFLDISESYLGHLAQFQEGIGSLKVVVDCSDGMAGVFIHEVIKDLPAQFTFMYDVPDGRFPHHDPNPLVEANLSDLKQKVVEQNADVGLCFDGDADRVMFVDEKAAFVSPDLITALLGLHFFKHVPRKTRDRSVVLYDVRSSRSVVEYVQKLGGIPRVCRVGHSFAKRLLRETNGIYGGELAGHYYFSENYYCDSGMIAALTALSILSREQSALSELISRIDKYAYSGEINFTVDGKEAAIADVLSHYRQGQLTDIDGIRVDFPTWWFNLRPSNTEPLLRLVVEANDDEELGRRVKELRHLLCEHTREE